MISPTTTTPRVALATCSDEPDLDEEGQALLDALRRAGAEPVPAVWDDPDVDWSGFDVVVLRSTWDYVERLEEFLAWVDRASAATLLLNDAALVRWTTDKRYLVGLAAAGVPIVPSYFVAPGEDLAHPLLDVEHVVKPTVSAGSRDTLRLGVHEAERSRSHVRAIHDSGRVALVQPYLDAVDSHGETALVHLDGVFSHAARKGPLLRPGAGLVEGLYAEEDIAAREPTSAELAVGRACLDALAALVPRGDAAPPLYARVDLVLEGYEPRVLEVELAEPSLFLHTAPHAADRFAGEILARLVAAGSEPRE